MLTWKAYYQDGSELAQRSEPGFTYKDINRPNLTAFGIYDNERLVVMVDLSPDSNGADDIGPKRLIWRKRHQMSSNGGHTEVHLVGWQRKAGGRNVQAVCYVTQAGEVVLGGQWQADRPLRHAIKPLPHETDLKE
jgi:hypothetical protein